MDKLSDKDIHSIIAQWEGEAYSKFEPIEWDSKAELCFFKAIDILKPFGVHRDMLLAAITAIMCKELGRSVSGKDIWNRLETLCNTDNLESLEDTLQQESSPVTFEFSLGQDPQFGEMKSRFRPLPPPAPAPLTPNLTPSSATPSFTDSPAPSSPASTSTSETNSDASSLISGSGQGSGKKAPAKKPKVTPKRKSAEKRGRNKKK